MANIWMDEARFFEHGHEQVVQLPGEPLREGNVRFDKDLHKKGNLKCRFCEASVYHRRGRDTVAGDNLYGPSDHFATSPGKENNHDESCEWPERIESKSQSKKDKSRGFKLHLNTSGYVDEFNEGAGKVYTRDEDRHIITLKHDLKTRESKSIESALDVIGFIQKNKLSRVRDSVVIHRDHVLGWDEFFIRYDRSSEAGQERLADLVRRVREEGPQPCLIEFNIHAGVSVSPFAKMPPIKSMNTDIGRDQYNRRHTVTPLAMIKTSNTLVREAFSQAGSYLLMGYVHHKMFEHDHQTNHVLRMDLTDSSQIAKVDLKEVRDAALKHPLNIR